MQIATITTFYPNIADPVRAVFMRNLIAAMRRQIKVKVIAPVPFAPPVSFLEKWRKLRSIPSYEVDSAGVVVHPRYLVIPKIDVLTGLLYFLSLLKYIRNLTQTGEVELLHVHCAYPDGVGVALAAKWAGIPYVVTTHGSDINVYAEKRALSWQIKWMLTNAASIIGVSEALCEKLRRLAPLAATRVFHIPCAGIDSEIFSIADRRTARHTLGIQTDGPIVLFAGRLVPIKSVRTLIGAWRRLCERHEYGDAACLVIIGDGPDRSALERMAKTFGIADRVRFIGEVEQKLLAQWLAASTIFCLPSLNEGTPNTVVEALASGRPVVASRVGGIPSLIREGNNGLLVDPGNEEELALAIQLALATSWIPADIAASVSEYSWEDLAQRNVEVLRTVLGPKGGESA